MTFSWLLCVPIYLGARLSSALAKMVETQGPQQDSIFQTQLMRNDGHGWYGMVWNGVLFACEMCINVLNI